MKKKKRSMPFPLKVVIFVFIGYSAVTLISLQMQINQKKDQIAELDKAISEKTVVNQELKSTIEGEASDEYIANVARTKFGYVSPGERVFVDTSSK